MKVTKVEAARGEYVYTDDANLPFYIRYSANDWMYIIGESHEALFRPKAIEDAYQAFKRRK